MDDTPKGPPKIDLGRILTDEPATAAERLEAEVVEWVSDDADAPAESPRTSSPAAPPPEAQAGATQAAELTERHLRLRADFENYRRRMERELAALRERAAEELVRDLLPVVDSFARALREAPSGSEASVREGVVLIQRQMTEVLVRAGLDPITAVGESFDPTLHEAVARQERPDLPDGLVLEELQRGYRFRGRLLRPALVVVACAPATGEDAAPSGAAGRTDAETEDGGMRGSAEERGTSWRE